jgi:hypothetical protein
MFILKVFIHGNGRFTEMNMLWNEHSSVIHQLKQDLEIVLKRTRYIAQFSFLLS